MNENKKARSDAATSEQAKESPFAGSLQHNKDNTKSNRIQAFLLEGEANALPMRELARLVGVSERYALCNLNLPYPVPLLCGALVSAFAYSVHLRAGLCFPVVIIIYHILRKISIDRIHKYCARCLAIMYIAQD